MWRCQVEGYSWNCMVTLQAFILKTSQPGTSLKNFYSWLYSGQVHGIKGWSWVAPVCFLFFRQIFQNIGKYDDTSGYFTIKLPRKVLPSAGGLKKHAGPPIAHPYSVYGVGSDYVQYWRFVCSSRTKDWDKLKKTMKMKMKMGNAVKSIQDLSLQS